MLIFKKILIFLLAFFIFLFPYPYSLTPAQADHLIGGDECDPADPSSHCVSGYSCQPSTAIPTKSLCKPSGTTDVFGKIEPPDPLKGLLRGDPSGTTAIGKFLTNFISLIYILAGTVFLLMLMWGAWDWLTSEGDKEKLDSARRKLINAVVGLILFAVAFAVLRLFGAFTGFEFFKG